MSAPCDPASANRLRDSMLALGNAKWPPIIQIGSAVYHHARTVKHDFWAATAFYDDPTGRRVVLKISRTAEFAAVPLIAVGRWLTRRELRFYRALADVPNIPRVLGVFGPTGFVHSYVAGCPLDQASEIPNGFFANLQGLLAELHRRGIAYVDTNKAPNILVGSDGQPHLIDFQISWDLHELGNTFLNRWFLRRLQREDFYHLLKHKRRLRPDELTPDQRRRAGCPSALIRLHRLISWPYFRVRRAAFKRWRQSGRLLHQATG